MQYLLCMVNWASFISEPINHYNLVQYLTGPLQLSIDADTIVEGQNSGSHCWRAFALAVTFGNPEREWYPPINAKKQFERALFSLGTLEEDKIDIMHGPPIAVR